MITKYKVVLVKKIIWRAEVIVEHDNDNGDEIADKGWAEFSGKNNTIPEFDYSTKIEAVG